MNFWSLALERNRPSNPDRRQADSRIKRNHKSCTTARARGRGGRDKFFAGIWNDLHCGARLRLRSPGFATVAILSLALGIGANTTIFQLFGRCAAANPSRKEARAACQGRNCELAPLLHGDFYSSNSDPTGGLWKGVDDQQQGFSATAAWATNRQHWEGGEAHYANALLVSGDFFHVLEIQPVVGRLISPADDFRGCGLQSVVLSYSFWQQGFGGRFQVIGVAPASFYGLEVGQNFDAALSLQPF